ncbi:DNA polymerase III subunit gamma/tau [Alysiella crassa]|uniref:DNA polymerase III subunit gamma/tau n=1 Tax=Alysiella crassa TaxID=153491 RepID=A0A376BW55_9NEIS|nr:DNA polymerase III subunit gamma/tau [Alysiella crassa]UOP06601.1 DNA polymerase III subunit gamma/tau [Alysiella crassa]SSY81139.1 DNA polymerase III subunit tau [Alysiella crassa]
MSAYQVLARKWRPKTFADLVGQQHVVKALQNALDKGRLHHAYLLTGTRGVGKTTIARILAKSLNCETPNHGEPCGVCQSCRDIDAGRFVDLLEIDAASNTGIDNIREVLENAQYAPTVGKYKVYIIDEVHMLSKSAFNAMLKTLEEPPEHVKFILATTDPHKVPITVLSRCLQFVLRNMTAQQVAEHLAHVLKTEQIVYEPAALALLGRAAQGSMRDALSLLDQAIAMGSGSVQERDVRDMIGAVDKRYLYELLTFLMEQDGENLIAKAQEMSANAIGFDSALNDLAMLLQRLALLKTVPSAIEHDDPERERLLHLAQYFSDEQIQLYYQCVIHGKNDLPLAPDEYAGFVMTLLRMLAFAPFAAKSTPHNTVIEGTQLHNPPEKKTHEHAEHSGSLKPSLPEPTEHFTDSQPTHSPTQTENVTDKQPTHSPTQTEYPTDSLKTNSAQTIDESGLIDHQKVSENTHTSSTEHSGSLKTSAPPQKHFAPQDLPPPRPEEIRREMTPTDDTPPWENPPKPADTFAGSLNPPAHDMPTWAEHDYPNDEFSGSLHNEIPFADLPTTPPSLPEHDEMDDEKFIEHNQLDNTPMPELTGENWLTIAARMGGRVAAAQMMLNHLAWVDWRDGVLTLAAVQDKIRNSKEKAYFQRIESVLSEIYGSLRLKIVDWQDGMGWETPVQHRERISQEQRDRAYAALNQDKTAQQLVAHFDGKWVDESVMLK